MCLFPTAFFLCQGVGDVAHFCFLMLRPRERLDLSLPSEDLTLFFFSQFYVISPFIFSSPPGGFGESLLCPASIMTVEPAEESPPPPPLNCFSLPFSGSSKQIFFDLQHPSIKRCLRTSTSSPFLPSSDLGGVLFLHPAHGQRAESGSRGRPPPHQGPRTTAYPSFFSIAVGSVNSRDCSGTKILT